VKLLRELKSAGVPAVGESSGRVALGGPYQTPTGQWVAIVGSSPEWVGSGEPTPPPPAAMLGAIAQVVADHVPDAPPSAEDIALRKTHRALRALYRALPESVREDWRRELGLGPQV